MKGEAGSHNPRTRNADPANAGIPADFYDILNESILEAASEIVSYVVEHGCTDLSLHLKVLDLGTRLRELTRFVSTIDTDTNTLAHGTKPEGAKGEERLAALEEMLVAAQIAVVDYVKSKECSDIRLQVRIMDLDTRLKLQ